MLLQTARRPQVPIVGTLGSAEPILQCVTTIATTLSGLISFAQGKGQRVRAHEWLRIREQSSQRNNASTSPTHKHTHSCAHMPSPRVSHIVMIPRQWRNDITLFSWSFDVRFRRRRSQWHGNFILRIGRSKFFSAIGKHSAAVSGRRLIMDGASHLTHTHAHSHKYPS